MTRASRILTLTTPVALVVLFSTVASRSAAPRAAVDEWMMYIGTYTRAPSKGIYAYRYPSGGAPTSIGLVAETENPSFLAIHPNQQFLYAVNEIPQYEGQPAGSVSAFSIDRATGALKLLNRVSSRGGGPCHVSIDRSGTWLFVANYGGGSVAAYPVHPDGSLGAASAFFQHAGSSANPQRQAGPHGHDAVVSPDNRMVLVADLGLDQILTYRLDPTKGGLAPGDPPFANVAPGSGPRHLAFRPDGKFVYALSEILSKVIAFSYDAKRGTLQELQTLSSLPDGFSGSNSTAEIVAHPKAPFVYASNRGHDSIAIFRIDPTKGTLAPVGHVSTRGKTPRNFALDPTGTHLLAANQNSNTIVDFRIDQKTGGLTPTGTVLDAPSPVCVVFAKSR